MKCIEWLAMAGTLISLYLIGEGLLLGWYVAIGGNALWILWGVLKGECTALIILNFSLILVAIKSVLLL